MGVKRLRWLRTGNIFVSDSPYHVTEGQTKNANEVIVAPKAKAMGAACGA